jgi:protein O-mannosyl-transferase
MVGLQYRGASYGLGVSWWAYALIECRVLVRYLGLAVWPHPLVFDYGDFSAVRHAGEVAPYVLVLFVLAVTVLIALWQRPVIGFVGAWFFLILAPSSSVVPLAGEPMAEHRMYLSLAAVVALVVVGIHTVLGRRDAAVFLALALVLGFLTTRRNEDYRTDSSIWEDTIAKRPDNLRTLIDLGVALEREGRIPEAMERFEHVLEIKPDDPSGHLNLGDALRRMGHMKEAIEQYEKALRVEPNYTKAYYGLGLTLWSMGRSREAISQYQEALRIDPDFVEAHVNLGIALAQVGDNQEALAHFTEALRLQPDSPEVHCNLGYALFLMGKVQEAIDHYEEALRFKPDYPDAHFNLGLALEKLGRTPEAIEHYQQALKLRPDFTPAKDALVRLGVGQ